MNIRVTNVSRYVDQRVRVVPDPFPAGVTLGHAMQWISVAPQASIILTAVTVEGWDEFIIISVLP